MKFLALSSVALVGASSLRQEIAPVCWKGSYGRGVGSVPDSCHGSNPDKNGALCYPTCQSGYYGVGNRKIN